MAPRDVPALLSSAAAERPDVVALVDPDDRRLTYAQLEEEVSRVASGLVAGDIVAGTRVLLACSNRLELVTCYLGVLRAQAVAVPVNPEATAEEMALMVADTGALVVVADADALATVREAVALVRAALAGEPTRLDAGPLSRAVVPRVVAVGAGRHGEHAPAGHRVDRVVDEVGPHLVQLTGHRLDARQRGRVVLLDPDAGAQLVRHDRQG
ncbi:MAG TPA: AMP-binding protein, partial [Nocardioides sp.]|uniref:AMP-binding protein n=1 Tax=Nocardioides sp. TaxID=35761 RepID=UPI002C675E10